MAESDVTSDRRRAREDEYFRRRDQELLEQQQRRAEIETERRLMAQAIGVDDDDEVILDLQLEGYTADTIVLLELIPSVRIAWADGSVSKPERDLLLQIAAREKVAQHSPAHEQLNAWLDCPPSDHMFKVSLRGIRGMLSGLQPEVQTSLRRRLIDDCTRIAAASGRLLGWGRHVSNDEQRTIDRIADELS